VAGRQLQRLSGWSPSTRPAADDAGSNGDRGGSQRCRRDQPLDPFDGLSFHGVSTTAADTCMSDRIL
jgi:hypothetical protein